METCDREEAPGALAAAMLPVQPWLDVPGSAGRPSSRPTATCAAAAQAAERMMDVAWDAARAVPDRPPLRTRRCRARGARGPAALRDRRRGRRDERRHARRQHRAAARGAAGRRRRAHPALHPRRASRRRRVRRGRGRERLADARAAVPRASTTRPCAFEGVVQSVFDGELRYTHPAALGMRAPAPGRAARVRVGRHRGRRALRHRAADRSGGLRGARGRPARVAIVQAKSHVSYRAGFERISHAQHRR